MENGEMENGNWKLEIRNWKLGSDTVRWRGWSRMDSYLWSGNYRIYFAYWFISSVIPACFEIQCPQETKCIAPGNIQSITDIRYMTIGTLPAGF